MKVTLLREAEVTPHALDDDDVDDDIIVIIIIIIIPMKCI